MSTTVNAQHRAGRPPRDQRVNRLTPHAHETGLIPDADLCLSFRISRSGLFNLRKRRLLPPPIKLGNKNMNDLAVNVAAIKRLAYP